MTAVRHTEHLGYDIAISQEAGRFTPRVTRAGALIEHNGRKSEIWAGASCGSFERALERATTAIATGTIK